MPYPTMHLRLFRRKEKIGVVESGPGEGNYIWGHGEPVLQQLYKRTDAEIEMHKRFRNVDVPSEEWRDIPIFDEE